MVKKIGILLFCAQLSWAQDIHPSWGLARDLYGVLSQIIEPSELNWMIAQQAGVIIGCQLVFAGLDFKLNAYYPQIHQHILKAEVAPGPLWGALWGLSSWAISRLAIEPVIQYGLLGYQQNFVNRAEEVLLVQYRQDDNIQKLSSQNQTRSLAKSMRQNVRAAAQGTSELLGTALKTGVDALFYTSILWQMNSFGVIPFTVIYQAAFSQISAYLSGLLVAYRTSSDVLESQIARLEENSMNRQEELGSVKQQELITQKSQLLADEQRVSGWLKIWIAQARTLDFALKYAYVGYKLSQGTLSTADHRKVFDASFAISNLMAWANTNNEPFVKASYAINATAELLKYMREIKPNEHFSVSYQQAPEFSMELRGVSIGFGDDVLLRTEHLFLKPGIYAVVGKSGSGKTTFLNKIKGLRYAPGWARGQLLLSGPREPKIVMVRQEDDIVPYSTLSEIAGAPLVLLQKEGSQYQDDWGRILSGGEKRVLALEVALNQNPDILILDEVFANMDAGLIDKAQGLIKERFSGKIVLAVDHEYDSHRQTGFYAQRLLFEEGKID